MMYTTVIKTTIRYLSYIIVITLLMASPILSNAAQLPNNINTQLKKELYILINANRIQKGLHVLEYSEDIEQVSQEHANDTAQHFNSTNTLTREKSYLAHTGSSGSSVAERFTNLNIPTGWSVGENTGYWTRNPFALEETDAALFDAVRFGTSLMHEGMMAEVSPNDAHKKNILGLFTHIGIAFALENTNRISSNTLFLVSNFARYQSEKEEHALQLQLHNHSPSRSILRALQVPSHDGPFEDVRSDDTYAKAITAMKQQNIIEGYTDGTFRPDDDVSRAELVKMITVISGINPIGYEFSQCFQDVLNEWYAPYICLAGRNGWITGYPDGFFRPNTKVTRAEGVTILARTQKLSPKKTSMHYRDVPEDAWYTNAIRKLASIDAIPFTNNLFKPEQPLTRGEVAELLYRISLKDK